jgi:hypothetical protein
LGADCSNSPLEIPSALNIVAHQLDAAGIGYRRHENSMLAVDDLDAGRQAV